MSSGFSKYIIILCTYTFRNKSKEMVASRTLQRKKALEM